MHPTGTEGCCVAGASSTDALRPAAETDAAGVWRSRASPTSARWKATFPFP